MASTASHCTAFTSLPRCSFPSPRAGTKGSTFPSPNRVPFSDDERTRIAQMWSFIGNLAATGDVNTGPFATATPWPLYVPGAQTNLVVANAGFSLIGEFDEAACDTFWGSIYI